MPRQRVGHGTPERHSHCRTDSQFRWFVFCVVLSGPEVAYLVVAHANTVLFPSVDRIAFHEHHARHGERGSRLVDPRDGVLRMGSGQAYAG